MLDFFRRYQRYFFLVITVVIIISFSFFGTYSTLGSNAWREQIAFTAVNGREITRSDVDEMATFLATDNEDKILFGGAWGPNFLNDGVIRKNFLETGLAQELVHSFQKDLREDIDKRLAKEKKYNLYSHPQAPFVGVQGAWSYFAPAMYSQFETLRSAQDGMSPEAFNARIGLFLGEKALPAPTLRQVLRFQEKQYSWLKPDPKLDQTDLSLFGYHTLEDWFGPRFTRLISEFIINAAILAEQQGYHVTKAEIMSDLVRNTQISYQQNLNNPSLGVTSSEEYLSEQLRRLNMDQARAIKIWGQILLFRRYFLDAGSTALVDNMAHRALHQFAHENVTADIYRLPPELRLANGEALQNFEAYLYAVAKQNKKEPLGLPENYLAVADVAKNYPELVQKNYELEVAQASLKNLQARIGLRELWNWEAEEGNFNTLKKQYPVIGVKEGKTRDERLEALDSLDPVTRTKVDAFAKKSIIKDHPEWIAQALNDAKAQKMIVGLRTQGGKMPFTGLENKEKRQEFMKLLDEAPLGPVAADSPLNNYSSDQQTYYRISVIERGAGPQILTFAEAQGDGTLKDVRNRVLERYYASTREQNPTLYKKGEGEWQPFDEVRNVVADQFLDKVLLALEPAQKEVNPQVDTKQKPSLSKDQAASLRFYGHLKQIKEQLEKDPSKASQWIKDNSEDLAAGLAPQKPLKDQWKIEKRTVTFNRQGQEEAMELGEAFDLQSEAWSALKTPANGALVFFQVKGHGSDEQKAELIAQQIRQAQEVLGDEAQRHLMSQVLKELKEKDALSLAYLQLPAEAPAGSPSEELE